MADVGAARGGASTTAEPGLSTFLGVFTPSILTILGVILFLRTGFVVGSLGLPQALLVIAIANGVTLATALSVSSVATNMHVGAGGAYYIISRSLGLEIGAAIGIPLFLAQAFSTTLYAFGLAESLQFVLPDLPQRPVAAATVVLVGVLAQRGARLALRLQLPIMGAIALALLVFGGGVALNGANDGGMVTSGAIGSPGLWPVFAVFFPAVTGIMAGISLSGDLANPKRAIPSGTIGAVLVGSAVYTAVAVLLSMAADAETLASNNLIWFEVAGAAGVLIFPGLWGAIFSSAVGSILGAPRTLQAMVADRVLPRVVGAGSRGADGTGRPLGLSMAVALGAVLLGDIDAVAPVLTMFFLTTYGTVNLVAGIERLTGDPSFRPTLRVPWAVSIAGALGCFWAMFLINPLALVLALGAELVIYLLMRRRSISANWGDLRRGALVALVRRSVLQIRSLPADPRNWRPMVLLFADNLESRGALARIADAIVQERGILTVAELVEGDVQALGPCKAERTAELNEQLRRFNVTAFGEVHVVDDFVQGAIQAAQSNGIAGIESNTVMFGWPPKSARLAEQVRMIDDLAVLGKSTVICKPGDRPLRERQRRIHVWWGGLERNGDMMVLFAHLIRLHTSWRDALVTVHTVVDDPTRSEAAHQQLLDLIEQARVDAHPRITVGAPDRRLAAIIHETSADADVVLLGLGKVPAAQAGQYAERLIELADGLPTTLFVRNAGEFSGRLLGAVPDPEEGTASEDLTP